MKKRKKGFSLKEEYKLSWNFIKESRKFIYLVVALFFVSALLGYFIPVSEGFKLYVLKFLEELLLKTDGLSTLGLMNFIFWNNLQSGFMGLVFGIALGILPLISTIANGYFLGFVSLLAISEGGIWVLWKLVPHGIFELSAIFISYGLGVKIGSFVFEKKKLDSLKDYFWNSLRVFIFVVLPLLIIAALIEGILISLIG
jgi:stage II sporulation protein M